MPNHSAGLYHLHIRKRIHLKKEKYPHPNKFKRYYDKLMYLVAILVPIMNLPQVYKIWHYRDASGVSLISWFSFFAFSVLWLGYGILHKAKPLIVMYSFLIIVQFLIVFGIFLYG